MRAGRRPIATDAVQEVGVVVGCDRARLGRLRKTRGQAVAALGPSEQEVEHGTDQRYQQDQNDPQSARQAPYRSGLCRQAADHRDRGQRQKQQERQKVEADHTLNDAPLTGPVPNPPAPICAGANATPILVPVTMELDPVRLRDAYDAQLRAWMPDRLPAGAVLVQDGPVWRLSGFYSRGFVTYVSVADVPSAELDAMIARQRDVFAAQRQAVEWKLHGHDAPADLADRLRSAGFEPEEQETVLIGLAEPLADADPPLPDRVRLREVAERADLDRIAAMESAVWNADRSHLATALEQELIADPSGTTVVVAEAASGELVCAGWIRYLRGTAFATLWGGSTLPAWRGRGIYKALVGYRAHLATTRGYALLQVDASDDSRPILLRCGFVAVTTTTPYVFTPSGD